jgi:hypothetical protein
VATIVDARFTALAEGNAAPPRYDAYQELLRGLDLPARREGPPAFRSFMAAARLDAQFAEAKRYALLQAGAGSKTR